MKSSVKAWTEMQFKFYAALRSNKKQYADGWLDRLCKFLRL